MNNLKTPEERLAAVTQNGLALHLIKDPTPEERLAAHGR